MVNGRLMPAGPAKMPHPRRRKGAFGRKLPRVQPRTAAIPIMVNRNYRVQYAYRATLGGASAVRRHNGRLARRTFAEGRAMAVYGNTSRDLHIHRNDQMHAMRDPRRT